LFDGSSMDLFLAGLGDTIYRQNGAIHRPQLVNASYKVLGRSEL
jgi:hypothetical protein